MGLTPCPETHSHVDTGVRLGSLSLIPFSYTAKRLLERTVVSFYKLLGEALMLDQQRHLAELNYLLNLLTDLTRINKNPFNPRLDRYFFSIMKCLDHLFFFGTLTEKESSIVSLQLIRQDAVEDNRGRHGGWCIEMNPVNGIPRHRIEIPIGARKVRRIHSLLETLVHEMIHAYLASFVCRETQCVRDSRNTIGIRSSRHGPTFRALQYAALDSLQAWSSSYRRYIQLKGSHILPRNYEVEQERDAFASEIYWIVANKLFPLSRPNRRDCIWVSESTVDINIERLREKFRRESRRPDMTRIWGSPWEVSDDD